MRVIAWTMSFACGLSCVGDALAHANVVPKDNLDAYGGRQYQEGTTAYFSVNLAHSCHDEAIDRYYPTRHVTVLFPNAADLTGIAFTDDGQGNRFAGNALMGVKPRVNAAWRSVRTLAGDVPEFYSHGAQSSDIRAVQWLGGNVPNDMYDNLELRATLPRLDGCVSRLRIYMPVVQYCEGGHVLAWLRAATPTFPVDVVSPGYASSLDVLRDSVANPLPESCGAEGTTESIYPSDSDIERYLTLRRGHGYKRHDD